MSAEHAELLVVAPLDLSEPAGLPSTQRAFTQRLPGMTTTTKKNGKKPAKSTRSFKNNRRRMKCSRSPRRSTITGYRRAKTRKTSSAAAEPSGGFAALALASRVLSEGITLNKPTRRTKAFSGRRSSEVRRHAAARRKENREKDDVVMCPLCLQSPWGPGRLCNARDHIKMGRCSHNRNVRVERVFVRNGDASSTPIAVVWSVQSSNTYLFSRLKRGDGKRRQRYYWTPQEFTDVSEMQHVCMALELEYINEARFVDGAQAEEIMKKYPIWESSDLEHTCSMAFKDNGQCAPAPKPVDTVADRDEAVESAQEVMPGLLDMEPMVPLAEGDLDGYLGVLEVLKATPKALAVDEVDVELAMMSALPFPHGVTVEEESSASEDLDLSSLASDSEDDLLSLLNSPVESPVPSDSDFSDIFDDDDEMDLSVFTLE